MYAPMLKRAPARKLEEHDRVTRQVNMHDKVTRQIVCCRDNKGNVINETEVHEHVMRDKGRTHSCKKVLSLTVDHINRQLRAPSKSTNGEEGTVASVCVLVIHCDAVAPSTTHHLSECPLSTDKGGVQVRPLHVAIFDGLRDCCHSGGRRIRAPVGPYGPGLVGHGENRTPRAPPRSVFENGRDEKI